MNQTKFSCNDCGIPCLLIMFNRTDDKMPDEIRGYCPFDSTHTTWYKQNET